MFNFILQSTTNFFINQLKTSDNKNLYAALISKYFIDRGIEDILNTFKSLDAIHIIPIYNNLIDPKEIQQKQAKYRGHGAEMVFAKVCAECGVHIIPETKHIDPMAGYDPNVNLSTMEIVSKDAKDPNVHSFDLVIKDDEDNIRVLIQSLIHSSDPGQYGVDKSNETVTIKTLIDYYNANNPERPVYLLGSVDGVGFSENPNGTIVKMIDVFDDFFQMNTLFKIAPFLYRIGLINNLAGLVFDTNFFEKCVISHFENTYMKPLNIKNLTGSDISRFKNIPAGRGIISLHT